MSLITRCPTCETLFKVVPDQLRISEGWVRCGQCDDIFDASLHLLPAQPVEEIPVAPPEDLSENYELLDFIVVPTDVVEAKPEPDSERSANDLSLAPEPTESEAAENTLKQTTPEHSSDEIELGENVATLSESRSDQEMPVEPDELASPESVDLSDVSFLQDKNNNSFWHKPLMRAMLGFSGFVLLLGLLGQGVVHERDRLVAMEPSLKPLLEAMCEPLNCTLSPLRQIESIVIDSSSFTKVRGDSYRLNLTLKSTAATAVAIPAIELTLTDGLDRPVVRRVFLATELGIKLDALTADAEMSASLPLAFKASGALDRVAGYRLLAFYP